MGALSLFPGQSQVLDCTASGFPPPSISWTRNGSPINFTSLSNIELATNGSLLLSNVTKNEEGNYSCMAVNQEGTAEHSFFLNIDSGSVTGSSALSPPRNLSVLSGSSLLLNCSMSASESTRDSVFIWRHESRVMCGDGNGSLLLSPVMIAHAGLYKCQELLNTSTLEMILSLTVVPRRGEHHFSSLCFLIFLTKYNFLVFFSHHLLLSSSEPPFFLVEPEDGYVLKRTFLLLSCSAASPGGEDTHLSWSLEEAPLAEMGVGHLILKNNSLLLINVRPSQAGSYSCGARNNYGHSMSTAQVFVTREYNDCRDVVEMCVTVCKSCCNQLVYFTCYLVTGSKVDRFVSARENSTVVLPCEVRGSEAVEWVKNGKFPVASHDGTLWLFAVTQSHTGEYTCSHQQDSFNYYLTVQGKV